MIINKNTALGIALVWALASLLLCRHGFAKSGYSLQAQGHDIGSWHIGVAVGGGVKGNPLRGGDDIPLLLLPDIHYYGDDWFFDNFTLGYSLYKSEQLVLSLVTAANSERAYFGFWHPSNLASLNLAGTLSGSSKKIEGEPGDELFRPLTIDDIPSRAFAWDSGILANVFTDWGELTFQLMADVSGVYQGTHARWEWTASHQVDNWLWRPALGMTWQSHKLIHYYYSVGTERQEYADWYQDLSGWAPFISMMLSRPITEEWLGVFNLKYQRMAPAMKRSPLVNSPGTWILFLGASYQF